MRLVIRIHDSGPGIGRLRRRAPIKRGRRKFVASAGLLVFAAMVPAGIVGTAERASASPPISCENQNYNVDGVEETSAGAVQTNIFGVRADVYAGATLYCNRVSSLAINGVLDSSSDRVFVEFGWVLGWSNCNSTYYSTPRLFVWWSGVGDGNAKHCRVLKDGGTTDVFHTMRIADTNSDMTWNAYYDNSVVDNSTINTNFSDGAAVDNAERSNNSDTAYAEFTNLSEYHSAWSAWENARLAGDNDPGFKFVRIAGDHTQVVAG